jgi:site-specific recombinase XerD
MITQKQSEKIQIRETFEAPDGTITPEFMKAYFEALASLEQDAPAAAPKAPREKTLNWLCDQYYRSGEFKRFDPRPYAALRRADVKRSRDKRAETPGAADKLVKYLRAMFTWAIKKELATINPASGVDKINESAGWHTWTPEEVQAYREHHKIGTKARLALELMMNVGARVSDACRIGRQHESNGWLKFVAWKHRNNKKSRRTIECPITPELRAAIDATETGDLTYLVNDLGKVFTIDGLGNKVRDWCNEAGLSQCSSHGLRKAAAVALAENGATAPELCAIFGWAKLETAEIYIRQAQRRVMAGNAFARLDEHRNRKSVSESGPKNVREIKSGKIQGKSNGK